MGLVATPIRFPPCQPQVPLKQSLPSTKISRWELMDRIALPAAVAATGQFCEVKEVGQPFVTVSPVQQEPLVELEPMRCGSLRRSMPITVGLPLNVNLLAL